MNRREFLLASRQRRCCAPALSFSGKLFAAPANAPRFLFVFLRGGYDCNNFLVPYSSDFYYESRPTMAIAKPDPNNPNSAIALDANWGINPVLRDSIYPLWQRKQIAFVPFAGTDDLSRSHFETQDNIERPANRTIAAQRLPLRLHGDACPSTLPGRTADCVHPIACR
jgi:uncharacterized protein (DUF1501 family)